MLTRAFTCSGPYAVLIMLGLKRVENRGSLPAPRTGRCAVGCAKSFRKEEYGRFVAWASQALPEEDFDLIPSWTDVKDWPGKIVGACDYACRGRQEGAAAWDEGLPYWWDLSEIACFDLPIPCRGNLGMWVMPRELADAVTRADALARSVGTKIETADDARRVFAAALPLVGGAEGFFVLPLDDAGRTLSAPLLVSLGTEPGTTVIRPRDVFAEALKRNANAVVVAHNHPSGDLTPSPADIAATAELDDLARRLGVVFLDHLLLGAGEDGGFLSLAETVGRE